MHVLLIYPNRPRLTFGFMPGPYGLEILRAHLRVLPVECDIVNPFLHPVPQKALAEAIRPDTILAGISVRNLDDALVLWNNGDVHGGIQTESCIDDIKLVVEVIRQLAPDLPILMGGAAFGHMPHRLLNYLGVKAGLRGAPERQFARLVQAMTLEGATFEEAVTRVPGVVSTGLPVLMSSGQTQAERPAVTVEQRESVYFRFRAEAAVRTYSGCPLSCSHCVEHVGSRRIEKSAPECVADEVETVLDRYPEVRRIFFADSEVNLGGEERTSELLHQIRRRSGARDVSLVGYFNPRPLSFRLLQDLRETNCEVRLTVDHVADSILERNGKNFRKRHLKEIVSNYAQLGLELSFSVLLGQPGETRETVDEVLEFVENIPAAIRGPVYFSPGVRVYPETPIERLIAKGLLDPRWLIGSLDNTDQAVRPLVYCESWHPGELFDYVRSQSGELMSPMNGYMTALPSQDRQVLENQFRAYHVGLACLDRDDESSWQSWAAVDHRAPFLTGRQRADFLWHRGLLALQRGLAGQSLEDWSLLEQRLTQMRAPHEMQRKVAYNMSIARQILSAERGPLIDGTSVAPQFSTA